MNKESKVLLRTGNEMPVLGLGTWQLRKDTAGTVARAFELGYSMIDTSGDYGTQPGIGEGLRKSGLPRERAYIVTKIEEDDDAYKATKKNLRELGLDYADLMLIHRPPPYGAGEALWRGLIRAKAEGLARDIGVSNYPIRLIEELARATGETPSVNQIEWSPFGYDEEMFEYAKDIAMAIQAYSPLTRGERLYDDPLLEIGEKYGKRPAQILIRWNLERRTAPLPKANDWEHLKENIDVFDFGLDHDDIRKLDALNERYSALGGLSYAGNM